MGGGVGRWPMEGGQGGGWGGGTREQCGSNKRCTVWFFLLDSLKNLTTGLVGRWPMEGGQGGRWGGGTREQCGNNKSALVHFFRLPSKPNNWSDLAVTRVGGWRAGKRGDGGGAPESSVGATKGALVPALVGWGDGGRRGEVAHGGRAMHWFPFFGSLKNRTTGLIWLVTRVGGGGEAWGGGPWRAGKGGDGEQQKCIGSRLWAPLAAGLIWLVTRVGGWGEAWGGGPWRAGKGGDGGGAPESSVGATKGALVPSSGFPNEGGGMGGGVGRWPMEGGQGGRWGCTGPYT